MATGGSARPGGGEAAHDPLTVSELFDEDTGRWQVTTETSMYLLDLDQRTMLRVPGAGIGVQRDPVRGHIRVTTLPADNQPVVLVRLLYCHTGESMLLLTEPWADGTVMVRGSTGVREIRSLPAARRTPRARS